MEKSTLKRVLALLLCLSMLVPYLNSLPLQAWAATGDDPTVTETPLAVVGAGSDFQYLSDTYNGVTYADQYAANKAMVIDMLGRVKQDYPALDAFLLCGDYDGREMTHDTSAAGLAAAYEALNTVYGLSYDQIQFVQGNHDPATVPGLDATGAYDRTHFGVYQINEDDFAWGGGNNAVVQTTAANLDAYLDQKAAEGFRKPIFVISHLHLHHSFRSNSNNGITDNRYAKYLVDVMNEGAAKGLNIVYLYGHNHSGGYDMYLGRDCVYLQPGTVMPVTTPTTGTVDTYEDVTLGFTYMNAGYMGYAGDTLSTTAFEIYEDRMVVTRYTKDGPVPLKKAGTNSSDERETWAANPTVVESPDEVSFSDITVTLTSTVGEKLPVGQTASVSLSIDSANPYKVNWTSLNEGVLSVTPDGADQTKATLTGVQYGTATVKVVVEDLVDSNAIPATEYLRVTVAPENAVRLNNGKDSRLFRLVTDWSTVSPAKRYLILNRNAEGDARCQGGPKVGGGRETIDPATLVTDTNVLRLPGLSGLYTMSVDDCDIWELQQQAGADYCQIRQQCDYHGYFAVNSVVAEGTSYAYPCGIRFASGVSSSGTVRWAVDAQNGKLGVQSYYLSGSYQEPTADLGLYYNSTLRRFEISATAADPVYLYEWTGMEGPDVFVWLTADSGEIRVGGDQVTGARIILMADGQTTELPITADLLRNAYVNLPGSRTCSVYYNGTLLSDQFRLTVTGDNGQLIEAVPLVVNNGNLYKLHTGDLPATPLVLTETSTAGSSYALTVKDGSFVRTPAELFESEHLAAGTLYVQAQDDGWIWDPEQYAGYYYYYKNRSSGTYLNAYADNEVLDLSATAAVAWRQNSTYDTISSHTSQTGGIQRTVKWDGSGYYAPSREAGGYYTFVPDTTLDRVLVYATNNTGSVDAGTPGEVTGVEIKVAVYYQDGSYREETVPVTISMLNLSKLDLFIPGNYPCTLTYEGKVLCEEFLLCVNAVEGDPVADDPVVYAESGQVFKMTTVMTVDQPLVLVTAKAPGMADAFSLDQINGSYTYPAVPIEVFTVSGRTETDGTDSLFVVVRDENCIFLPKTSPTAGKYFLYNERHQGYVYGDNQYNLYFVTEPPADANHVWRYSGTYKTIQASFESVLVNKNGIFDLTSRSSVTDAMCPQAYVVDEAVDVMLAYVDSLSGACEIGASTGGIGGNVVLKTILKDGTVTNRTVPITLDMLDLTPAQLLTPGSHTCKVIYNGVEITDEYSVTITADMTPAAPPLDFSADWQLYELVPAGGFVKNNDYVLVDANAAGDAHVLTAAQTADGWQATASDTMVMEYNGTVYAVVKESGWNWAAAAHDFTKPDGTTASGLSLLNEGSGLYLGATAEGHPVLRDRPSDTYAWRYASGGYVAGSQGAVPEGATTNVEADLAYVGGFSMVTRAVANANRHVYAYKPSASTLRGMVIFTDALEGSCVAGSNGSTAVGGTVHVHTLVEGVAYQQQAPITLDMLDLTAEQRLLPGTYTCKLMYQGEVLADNYRITVTGAAGENPPADETVTIIGPDDLVLRSTVSTWGADIRWAFAEGYAEDQVKILGVSTEGGTPVIVAQTGHTFKVEDSDYSYLVVRDPGQIFTSTQTLTTGAGETVTALNDMFMVHEQTGKYLFVNEEGQVVLADADTVATLPNGWRNSLGDLVTGSDDLHPHGELSFTGDTIVFRDRYSDENTLQLYLPEETINSRLGYVDSITGSCKAGDQISSVCGGNVVVKTLMENGTVQTRIEPITLSMLSVDYTQLLVPGTYTCSVSYEGVVLTDAYELTVEALADEKPAATEIVTLIDQDDQVYRLYNDVGWIDAGEFMFVSTDTAGEAKAVSITVDENGNYTVTAADTEAFTIGSDGNLYVVSQGDHQVWSAHKTLVVDGSGISTSVASRFFMANEAYDGYLFVNENYELGFVDAKTATGNRNGWRVSSKGLVTGTAAGEVPYADLIPRGDEFISRYRHATSGNMVDTARVYVRDSSVQMSFAYLDQTNGGSTVDNTESYACGGNIIIKTVLADGTVVTDQVPITLDMLQLDYGRKHTAGTYTCPVVYRGQVIFDSYELTVTDDHAGDRAAAATVIFDDEDTVYTRSTAALKHLESYMFVDTREPGSAYALVNGADGSVAAVPVEVFTIDGGTAPYVVAKDPSHVWTGELRYNETNTKTALTFYNAGTGKYLFVTKEGELVIGEKNDTAPFNHSWQPVGNFAALGYGASSEDLYVTIKNVLGSFEAVDRYTETNDVNAAYLYVQDETLEGRIAYVTALSGSCDPASAYDTAINGSIVIKTYHDDGTVTSEEIPLTLGMLQGIDPLDLYVPGTYTGTVVYNGQVIAENYALTINSSENAAATRPVIMADENTPVFKYVEHFVSGEEYIFVNRNDTGKGQVLAVTKDGDVFILDDPAALVSGDGINKWVISHSDGWVWIPTLQETDRYILHSETAGLDLMQGQKMDVILGSHEDAPVRWRITSTHNLATGGGSGSDSDLVNYGDGFRLVRRSSADRTANTYAYQRDDSLSKMLAYLDGLSGAVVVGQSGQGAIGGNVIIDTYYDNGESGRTVIPITLDMLDLTLTQLTTPGVYTTTVTCDGYVLTDQYVVTVIGEEHDNMIEIPGDGNLIRGYVAALDKVNSDPVPVGTGGRIPTGSTITLYTYYTDGSVEVSSEPVTLDMLNVTTEQMEIAGTYTDLTLTYKKLTITEDYTLNMVTQYQDDYPDFPDEGAVKVDKQIDTTKYNYLQTGTAQIDLSVAGIPTTSKANVVVILDASSSMTACTHEVYNNHRLASPEQYAIIDKAFAMEETLTAEEITFLQSLDFPGYDDVEKYQARIQSLIDRTITHSELVALKKGMRCYGMCYQADTDTYRWVGEGEENCKYRYIITQEALAELLEFLKQDMDGYDMDIDVAVAYFNQLYPINSDLIFLNDDPQIMTPRSQEELMLPFTNSKDVVVEDVLSRYQTISGTNYDRGMEWIYQLLSQKQTADYQEYLDSGSTDPYRARQDFVLFMSDGAPGQFNYMVTNNAREFSEFYSGKIPEDKLQDYVSEENLPAFREMYHPEGKLWMAEAIKGEKTRMYKVIDPSMPETNYVNYVPGLDATIMTVTLNSFASTMYRIASSEDYYIPTETADDIQQAFGVFGSLVKSGSGAVFMDQMGPEFDLQMSNTVVPPNIKDLYVSADGSWDTFSGTQTTRTVYLDANNMNWETYYIYTWNASGYPTGAWPGSKMIHLGNGIHAFEVPVGVTNVIFNNGGKGSQTADLSIPGSRTLYRNSTKSWHSFATRTVYFDAAGSGWSTPYAYTWGGSGISTTSSNFPGSKMIHLGGTLFSCEIPTDVKQIIFSNGSGTKTADLTVPTNGKDLYRFRSGAWDTYETRTIYFDNNGTKWGNVCAYTWDENGAFTTTAWPGIPMTHIGNGIYMCKIPADAQIIQFNDGTDANKLDKLAVPPAKIELNSAITVKTYPLYKYSEHLENPTAVPMEQVGKRKENAQPEIIEVVTFSDDGTEAYSNLIGDGKTNILIDGVICAQTFWYNTAKEGSVTVQTGAGPRVVEPETFCWKVDAVPEDELVLSYNVYLTGTLEGTREKGSYPTNNYAYLSYTNHLGNPCQLDTTSPMLPWHQAVVGYAFYLVDSQGNPVVNESEYLTGSFEKAIRMTQPKYIDLLYNSAENVDPWELKAKDLLPAGYTLYDPTATYAVKLYADGEGSWQISGNPSKLTTYVTGYGGVPTTETRATAGMSTEDQTYDYPAYATASTVVWFAVRADVNTVPDTVVIDYGVSVDIHVLANDVVITNQNSTVAGLGDTRPPASGGVDFTQTLVSGFTGRYNGRFGTAMVQGDVVRYTPNTMQMTAEDSFSYCANHQGTRNPGYYYSTVTVIPATSIYFEDNFGSVIYANGANADGTYGVWQDVDNSGGSVATDLSGVLQDEDRPGAMFIPGTDADRIYGFDSLYTGSEGYSMGSAKKVRVAEGKDATATFTFTGTGFDLISLCSNDTGMIMVDIYEGDEIDEVNRSNLVTSLMVDTFYGCDTECYKVTFTFTNGKWEQVSEKIEQNQMGTSQKKPAQPKEGDTFTVYLAKIIALNEGAESTYQIPVIKHSGLDYGTYTVQIYVAWSWWTEMNRPNYQWCDFYLDAIRIHDPANNGADSEAVRDAYLTDHECWPVYQELRNMFITQESLPDSATSGVVFMDGFDAYTVGNYQNFGPNNEVYLAPGQSVGFKLDELSYNAGFTSGSFDTSDESIVDAIHIGLKGITGSGAVTLTNGVQTLTADTGHTEQYYDITDMKNTVVTVQNTGTGLISITSVKVTHTAEPVGTDGQALSLFAVNREIARAALAIVSGDSVEDAPVLTPKYPTLSFEGEIKYNIYFEATGLGELTADRMGLAIFDTADQEGTVETAAATRLGAGEEDGLYVVSTAGIPAKNLGDKRYFKLFLRLEDGSYVYSKLFSYSAVDYANSVLGSATASEKQKALVVAMLRYGAEAQSYFGYNTDSPMDSILTEESLTLLEGFSADSLNAVVPVDSSKTGSFAATGDFGKAYPTVSFEGAFQIQYYFAPAHQPEGAVTLYCWRQNTAESWERLTADNADAVITARPTDGEYVALSPEIAAKELDQTLYVAAVYESEGVTYCSGVLAYSLAAYCKSHANDTMGSFATAAAIYGCAAKQYFEQ